MGAKLVIIFEFCTMKVKDLLFFSEDLLKKLHDFGIKINDYQYVNLLNDYEKMKGEGNKQTYVVAKLSQKYNICERKIYKVLYIRIYSHICHLCFKFAIVKAR